MDNQHFSYDGWTFRREQNGSLIIEPGQKSTGSEVFKDQPTQQKQQHMQSITIPQEDVYRLLGYCLTGDLDNTQVVQTLKSQYSLVGGSIK